MRMLRRPWAVGAAAALLTILVVGWSVTTAWRGYQLAQFEAEHPPSLERTSGRIVDRVGFGPLRLDVVAPVHGGEVLVHTPTERPAGGWPRPAILLGDHGARYVDDPATDGAWVPFALAAATGLLLAGAIARRFARPMLSTYDQAAFVLFGQDDAATRRFWWLPGHGGHGGHGGQVPPHVPYSPDWEDPERRLD